MSNILCDAKYVFFTTVYVYLYIQYMKFLFCHSAGDPTTAEGVTLDRGRVKSNTLKK